MATNAAAKRHIILTGFPGVGKTTLIHKVCELLKKKQIPLQGFYTEEIKHGGRRTGFDVVTMDGNRGQLARISQDNDVPSTQRAYRVGQYCVELQSFEQVALPTLRMSKSSANSVFIIDEVGRMELFSQTFIKAVKSIFDDLSTTVIATIPVPKHKPIPLVEEIRNRKDVHLFTVTKENRNSILENIMKAISDSFSGTSEGT